MAADEPKTMDIIDFLVDGGDLVGKTVTVAGCKFQGADTHSVMCSAGLSGNAFIDSASLDKEDLRKALKTCTGIDVPATCAGTVTGTVAKAYGQIKLTKAKITWAQ